MKTQKNLSGFTSLNHTLNNIYNHATMVGAKVPANQAFNITFGETNEREHERKSFCCNATISDGYCMDCNAECY